MADQERDPLNAPRPTGFMDPASINLWMVVYRLLVVFLLGVIAYHVSKP